MKNKLQLDQIKALKKGDKVRLNTLRYLLSKIKNEQINKKKPLTDGEIIAILRKERKELRDSIITLAGASRSDLAKEYRQQIKIINDYLPKELSDQQLIKEVRKIVNQESSGLKNKNALIGICINKLKGKAEAKKIVSALRSL